MSYIGKTGRVFEVRLQEHRQEVTQRDVRTSKFTATQQNKSAVISLPIIIYCKLSAQCASERILKIDQ